MVDVNVNNALSSALDSIKVCMPATETLQLRCLIDHSDLQMIGCKQAMPSIKAVYGVSWCYWASVSGRTAGMVDMEASGSLSSALDLIM
jgi:hypothetical protein